MSSIATISFVDADSGDEGFIGVRVEGGAVGLSVSLRSNGDVEVFVGQREVEALIDAFREAQRVLSNREGEA